MALFRWTGSFLALSLLLPSLAWGQDQSIGEFTVGGQTFVLILRPKQVTPPPPPPIRRSVYGVQQQDGTWTREVTAGDVIRLRGEGLGMTPGQVWLAGIPAEVIAWNNTEISVRVGRVEKNEIGGIRVAGQGWEVRSPFDVSVTPRKDIPPPPPPPPPAASPTIYGYTGAVGEPVMIDGRGFGSVPGKVLQDGVPVEVVLWSDTRIVVTSRGSNAPMPGSFAVIRADGVWYTGQVR